MTFIERINIFKDFSLKKFLKKFSIKNILNNNVKSNGSKHSFKNNSAKTPKFYQILWSISQSKIFDVMAGFIFGVLLGIGLFELVLNDLEFDETLSAWIGLTLCLMLGVGNAASIQIRCISLLTLPSICGRAGRSALKALVLTLILAGPIKNLTLNAREVVRVFSCTTELTYNLTKTRFDLMFKPFQEAILNVKADTSEMKQTMKSVNKVIRPLSAELEDGGEVKEEEEENDYIDSLQGNSKRSEDIEQKYKVSKGDSEGDKIEKNYMKKLETRCEEVISRGTGKCHDIFKNAYNKCYDKVSFMAAWLLCWPMKLTFVCNIMDVMGGGAGACDARKEVEPGFGESFSAMRESGDLLEGKKGSLNDVKIKFEPIEFHPPISVADAKEAALSLQEDFNSKKAMFDSISVIARRLLSLIFLKVLLTAQEYHDKYLLDYNHDNYWITPYFRRIDARRYAARKTTLLPLKKAEKTVLCSVTALVPRPQERKAVMLQFIKIALEAVTATVFILLDRLFSEILLIIRKHSKIDYTQTGKHDLIITIKGTGMMARIVRSILGGFNIRKEVQNERSNAECLPDPNQLSMTYIVKIYSIYLIIWLLILSEAYTQRLRRVICSFFYRKLEKKRILFLYNESLKKRASYIKRMAAKVKERAKEAKLSGKRNFLMYLRFHHPKYFGWLNRVTVIAQQRCLVCGLPESKLGLNVATEIMRSTSLVKVTDHEDNLAEKKEISWHLCKNLECHSLYCKECWRDMKNVCYVCSAKDVHFTADESANEMSDE